ncbi:unnamed protein product [Cylindrotheca closterium]|uniref:HSF-type DNA-binding domain-containing protein n=1 Tax=Cylindrotheca closterium TaxID=2856 RepID=A0AAD2CPN9_9STRA|nr:unnamed protein product [Cylindrotheca closterium]
MNRIPDIDREIAMMDERFTVKLHRILEDAQAQGFSHVIQWDPGGRSFTIHQPDVFSKTIMKTYFRQTKYKSFQRQLNLYEFKRETRNGIRGVYSHPLFVQHDRFLCQQIKRKSQQTTPAAPNPPKRQRLDEVALPRRPPVMSLRHPFDTSAVEASRTAKAADQIRYQKNEDDDDSIETIEGFVNDVDAGELFKVFK